MGLSQQDVAALSSTRPRLTAYSLAKLTHVSMSKGGSVGGSVDGSVGVSVSVGSVDGTGSVGAGSVGSAVDGNVDDGWVDSAFLVGVGGWVGTANSPGVCGSVSVCGSVASEVGLVCCGSQAMGIFDGSI